MKTKQPEPWGLGLLAFCVGSATSAERYHTLLESVSDTLEPERV